MRRPSPDRATVQSLRADVALQLARFAERAGATQVETARRLGVPQPTLSKILNGRVAHVSLEFLIRVAVRAGLALTLQTGRAPQEAGAFRSGIHAGSFRTFRSGLADAARESRLALERRLTPAERAQAFLENNQLLGALEQAGRSAAARRISRGPRGP